MFKSVTDLVRKSLHRKAEDRVEKEFVVEKFDLELTDNMRALRLATTLADQLLSRGMAASDVVHLALGVTTTYCSRKVHIDISHTILTVSQDRGVDREPLTIVRTISSRGADYESVRLLENLGHEIRAGGLQLDAAERRLDEILARPRLYPKWVTHASTGGVSLGVVMLYSTNPIVWAIAFIMGYSVNMTLYRMARRGLPSFYSQVLAGLIITVIAAAAALVADIHAIPILNDVNPTLIVIGGIVLLVAGMMIVSALQDAIDEYYVTAAARLLKVIMMTSGIVLGTTIGLYIATRLGVTLATTPDRLTLAEINYRYVGAAILAGSFALGNQLRIGGVIVVSLVGFLSLYTVLVMTSLNFGVIPASGIAAVFVGLSATLVLRLLRIPTLATISAGIIPLVPGLTLYSGLTYLAQSEPNTDAFDTGIVLILRAILIAVVVAAGATLGNLIGRPARRRLIHYQNRLPRRRLSRNKRTAS